MIEPILTMRHVSKAYGQRRVLDEVSLDVHVGEVLAIMGRNGMGKTTAVEIAQGIRGPDSGQVRIAGMDPGRDRSKLRGVVGSQLQSSGLPDRLHVDEALRLFGGLAGNVVDWRSLREEWDLTKVGRSAYTDLSGGERQRLFIALALVNQPRIVFLDELTQGLDPVVRAETWRHIARIRDAGTAVVLVTHDMVEAESLSDRVLMIHDGRVVAEGKPDDLIARFGGPVRVRFTAEASVLNALDTRPDVRELRRDADGRVTVMVDAHAVVPLAADLHRRGFAPVDFCVVRPGLGDIFGPLTDQHRSVPVVEAEVGA